MGEVPLAPAVDVPAGAQEDAWRPGPSAAGVRRRRFRADRGARPGARRVHDDAATDEASSSGSSSIRAPCSRKWYGASQRVPECGAESRLVTLKPSRRSSSPRRSGRGVAGVVRRALVERHRQVDHAADAIAARSLTAAQRSLALEAEPDLEAHLEVAHLAVGRCGRGPRRLRTSRCCAASGPRARRRCGSRIDALGGRPDDLADGYTLSVIALFYPKARPGRPKSSRVPRCPGRRRHRLTPYLPRQLVAARGIHEVSLYVHWDGREDRESDLPDFDAFYDHLRTATSCRRPRSRRSATSSPSTSRCSTRATTSSRSTSPAASPARSTPLARRASSSARPRPAARRGDRLAAAPAAALGLVVLAAARGRARGADVERVVARAREARDALKMWFAVDTLEYLRRGGRIGAAQAWLGSALKIKPILTLEARSRRSSACAPPGARSSGWSTTCARAGRRRRRLGRPAHPGARRGRSGSSSAAARSSAPSRLRLRGRPGDRHPRRARACSASAGSRAASAADCGRDRGGRRSAAAAEQPP